MHAHPISQSFHFCAERRQFDWGRDAAFKNTSNRKQRMPQMASYIFNTAQGNISIPVESIWLTISLPSIVADKTHNEIPRRMAVTGVNAIKR